MSMPTFTAEASLYKTSGHYRIHRARQAVSSSAQMISPVSPALFQRPETVEVHSCPVGWSDFGGTCYPPLTEPPVGGGGGGDMPPGGGPEDGGPGGPYSTKYPNRGNPYASWGCTSNNPIFDWQNNPDALACVKQNEKSKGPVYHSVFCRRKGAEGSGYPKKNELFCCKENTETNRVYDCEDIPCNTCQP